MTRYLHYAIKGPRTQARKRRTNVTEGTSPAFRRGLPNLVSALCLTNLAVLLILLFLLDPYILLNPYLANH
jgi:hypothetical protein